MPHLDKYPLITERYYDYRIFEKIVVLMIEGAHNTLYGLERIVSEKAYLGLSKELKKAFPLIIPTKAPYIKKNIDYKNLPPQ
jgi:hypothetical protein